MADQWGRNKLEFLNTGIVFDEEKIIATHWMGIWMFP